MAKNADDQAALRVKLQPIFAESDKKSVSRNIKFDAAVLLANGILGTFWDTLLAAWLLMPDATRSMDALSEQLLNYRPVSIETLIGPKGKDQGSMADVPLKQLRYAAEDADVTAVGRSAC